MRNSACTGKAEGDEATGREMLRKPCRRIVAGRRFQCNAKRHAREKLLRKSPRRLLDARDANLAGGVTRTLHEEPDGSLPKIKCGKRVVVLFDDGVPELVHWIVRLQQGHRRMWREADTAVLGFVDRGEPSNVDRLGVCCVERSADGPFESCDVGQVGQRSCWCKCGEKLRKIGAIIVEP